MKNFLTLLMLASALIGVKAFAFVEQISDPQNGQYEIEYKTAVKSAAAGYSDAITKGHALFLSETELTGAATVSRYNAVATGTVDYPLVSCIAKRSVATGDVANFPCVTRGYVEYAIADGTAPIVAGNYLCIGTAATVRGVLIACSSGTSKFVALQALASGVSTTFKVLVK